MYTKRVMFQTLVGVALTVALTGGSALVAGALDAGGAKAAAAASAPSAADDVVTADARATSAALRAANANRGQAAARVDQNDRAAMTGPVRCEDAQLSMDYVERPDRSTSGVDAFDLVFTNIASQPCSLDGWPGLVAEDADGATLTWALASGTTSKPAVLPPNGGRAVAEGTADVPAATGCAEATSDHLRAYISSDGAGGGIVDDVQLPVCTDGTWTLWLGPLTALHGKPGEVTPPAELEPEPQPEPEPHPAKCQDEQLALEFVSRPDLSADGASAFEFVFTNMSDTPCAMWGWPGLVVESADGARIGSSWAVGTDGEPFVIANGDAAVVVGTALTPTSSSCEATTADHVRANVTSDGAGPGVVATAPLEVCADGSSVLEIGPLTPA
ncbi:DUF4232 domain-containing protein [Agromyces italicus]|uniref:DUF4232 domain-containing protein n=1 Tax=Agromyces italicus TaxID=279572 RepID=UPI0003B58552|nr:DUF4232 domain-containing protein [Agromyces italicus]